MTQIVLEPVERPDVLQSTDDDVNNSRAFRSFKVGSGFAKRLAAVRAIPNVGTYVGVTLIVIGAVLLAIAWGKVAGVSAVGLQLPYVMSAGFTGLSLIASGLTVVNISAKLADSRERSRQATELHGLLAELRRVVEEDAR